MELRIWMADNEMRCHLVSPFGIEEFLTWKNGCAYNSMPSLSQVICGRGIPWALQ